MGWFTTAFCLAYGSARFLLDFLRASDVTAAEPRLGGLTFAQYWSLAVVGLGITLVVKRRRRSLVGAGAAAAFLVFSFSSVAPCEAAERWVDRPMTLHRLVFAGDVGLGVGHAGAAPRSLTGAGLNLEGAIGVTETVELGLRTGVRFGDEGRAIRADDFGRTLWTETYGTGEDTFANPEARVSVGVLPPAASPRWGSTGASTCRSGNQHQRRHDDRRPARLPRVGQPAYRHRRLTSRSSSPTGPSTASRIPGYFWFQPSPQVWLGPMTALSTSSAMAAVRTTPTCCSASGSAYQVANAVDLKTWFLFPTIDDNPGHNFGFGFGVQFRIGD